MTCSLLTPSRRLGLERTRMPQYSDAERIRDAFFDKPALIMAEWSRFITEPVNACGQVLPIEADDDCLT